jgi:hypothetical protein
MRPYWAIVRLARSLVKVFRWAAPRDPYRTAWSEAYSRYMLSPEWRARRAIAIQAAGGRCRLCYSPVRLEAHHRTYLRFGHELPDDITVLCHGCHTHFRSKLGVVR